MATNVNDMLSDMLADLRVGMPSKNEFKQMGKDGRRSANANHLERLDARLKADKDEHGISMKKYKDEIRKRGICLSDCKEYGRKLKPMLQNGHARRIPKATVKPFPYAKQCLIDL